MRECVLLGIKVEVLVDGYHPPPPPIPACSLSCVLRKPSMISVEPPRSLWSCLRGGELGNGALCIMYNL